MKGRTIILIFAVVNLLSGLGLAVCGVLDLNATGPNSGEGGLLSTCLGGLELAGGLLLLASAGGLCCHCCCG